MPDPIRQPNIVSAPPISRAAPHRGGILFRLLGLFNRRQRPLFTDAEPDTLWDPLAVSRELERTLTLGSTRKSKLEIFDTMDTFGLVSAILDLYTEETLQTDYDTKKSIWIEAKNDNILTAARACLHNVRLDETIYAITRRTVKYGDAFQRLLYATGRGVVGWRMSRTLDVERVEDKYARLVGFKETGQKFRRQSSETSWPWDYVHFLMRGKDEQTGYGNGVCEAMFHPWRRMALTEDAVLMYRLRRFPERNLITIPVGEMEEGEAMNYVNNWRKMYKVSEFIDPASAQYKKQFNPLTPMDDIYLPIRSADEATTVQSLAGGGDVGQLFDLEHFRDAFFGSAAVPKAYLAWEEGISNKNTLLQLDVRFARRCKRVQKSILVGIHTLLDIHFALLQGQSGDPKYDTQREENRYIVQASPISYLDELERLDLITLRLNTVGALSSLGATLKIDPRVWTIYVLTKYLKMSDKEVAAVLAQTAATPPVVPNGGPVFNGMSSEDKKAVIDAKHETGKGYYNLSESDQRIMDSVIESSPDIRRGIERLRILHDDDGTRNSDRSMLPVVGPDGEMLSSEDNTEEYKRLNEDFSVLRGRGIINEA